MSQLRCPEQRGRNLLRELRERATEDRDAGDGRSSASATRDADLIRPPGNAVGRAQLPGSGDPYDDFLLPTARDVSIVYAAQVNGKVAAGDRAGALESSRNARMWAWISFGSGLVLIVGYLILLVVGALAQS